MFYFCMSIKLATIIAQNIDSHLFTSLILRIVYKDDEIDFKFIFSIFRLLRSVHYVAYAAHHCKQFEYYIAAFFL